MNPQSTKRKAKATRRPTEPLPEMDPEARARKKVRALWQHGDLFHMTNRYPRRYHARRLDRLAELDPNFEKPASAHENEDARNEKPKIDRLAGILRNGLVAPGSCQDGTVCSDLHLLVTGASMPYDSLVFLHRMGPRSAIYTICEPGRFAVSRPGPLLSQLIASFLNAAISAASRACASAWRIACAKARYGSRARPLSPRASHFWNVRPGTPAASAATGA